MTNLSQPDASAAAVIATYRVEGMTCGHCVSAVIEELGASDAVNTVSVELSPGASSTVTVVSTGPITDGQVAAALNEAGDYRLVDAAG
jgi:copper chaperone CopZ